MKQAVNESPRRSHKLQDFYLLFTRGTMASGTTKGECLCLALIENLLGNRETKNGCHSHEQIVTRKELKSYDWCAINESANFKTLWGRKINSWG